MISEKFLIHYSATTVHLSKGQLLFQEGQAASFYWQVKEGKIKMVNYSSEGQEFVQGIFEEGQSFGEPPLFTGAPYPSSAVAMDNSVVYRLVKDKFMELLKEHFEIHLSMTTELAKRLQYKAMIMKEISSHSPEHRLMTILNFFKKREGQIGQPYEVVYTRQQLADLTGLRVETVIRAIKSLEQKGKLQILKKKIVV